MQIFATDIAKPPKHNIFYINIFSDICQKKIRRSLQKRLILTKYRKRDYKNKKALAKRHIPNTNVPYARAENLKHEYYLFGVIFNFLFTVIRFKVDLL